MYTQSPTCGRQKLTEGTRTERFLTWARRSVVVEDFLMALCHNNPTANRSNHMSFKVATSPNAKHKSCGYVRVCWRVHDQASKSVSLWSYCFGKSCCGNCCPCNDYSLSSHCPLRTQTKHPNVEATKIYRGHQYTQDTAVVLCSGACGHLWDVAGGCIGVHCCTDLGRPLPNSATPGLLAWPLAGT